MEFSDELINDFIKYTHNEGYESAALATLVNEFKGKVVPVASSEFWINTAENLNSSEKLEALIKGMLSFYNQNKLHTGGSVSPIRWLYEVYRDNYPDCEPELCKWIVSNRNNNYEPFGTICSNNAKSWKEHRELEITRKNKSKNS